MTSQNNKISVRSILINFIRPDITKLLLLALISSIFLTLQTDQFFLPPLQDCPLAASHEKLTGIPFAFYTSDRLENNQLLITYLLLDLIIYYLITSLLTGIIRYGIHSFAANNKNAKLSFVALASGLFVFGFVSLKLLSQDWLVKSIQSQNTPASRIMLILGTTANSISIKSQNHALHEAVRHNNTILTKLLLSYGANANKTDHNGQTALHLAVSRNAIDSAELLLKHGANPESQDQNGRTPAHYACSLFMAKLLVKHNARANIFDKDRKRPAEFSKNIVLKKYWTSIQKPLKDAKPPATTKVKPKTRNISTTPTVSAPTETKVKKLSGCTYSLGGTLFAHGKQYPITTHKDGTITAYSGVHGFAYANCKTKGYYHIRLITIQKSGLRNTRPYINLFHNGGPKAPLSRVKNQTALIQLKTSSDEASIYWYFSKLKIKNLRVDIKRGKISEIGHNKLLIKKTQ